MRKFITLSILVFLLLVNSNFKGFSANGDTLKVTVHDKVDMTWYGYYDKWGVFPDSSNTYRKILMYYTMGCATGGCSPWDYTTKIEARHKTGKIDSTLVEFPKFTVGGFMYDTLLYSFDTTYITYYDSISGNTDSTASSAYEIILFNDSTNPQAATDTVYGWPTNYLNYYYDNTGNIIDSALVGQDTMLVLAYWQDYNIFDVIEPFELARVITPYGGNLPSSYAFTQVFDVTDFEHILRDSVEIRAKYEGWSSGFSVTLNFEFITGTPVREVKKIENIYQGDFSYPNSSTFEANYLYPKNFLIDASTEEAKVRMTTTGHGFDNNINAAEFKPIYYYLKVNGQQTHTQLNWRGDCGENPIYPDYETTSGYTHTWLYDRANWCPGLKAHTFEHDITSKITSGDSVELNIDFQAYAWSGTQTPSYIVECQLVQYGTPNFTNDAELLDIISPSVKDEYARKNPICRLPQIIIKNNGKTTLTTVEIEYGLKGGTKATYQWTGSLTFTDTAYISLPVSAPSTFWNSSGEGIFEVSLKSPNGVADEYPNDNNLQSVYEEVPVYPGNFLVWLKTNTQGNETAYRIYDENGSVVIEKSNLQNSKEYKDTLNLGAGCYTFEITDSGEDGLSFPYNNAGNGYVRFKEIGGSTFRTFKANFGSNYVEHFRVDEGSSIKKTETGDDIRVYPNPGNGKVNIEMNLEHSGDVKLEVFSVAGIKVQEKTGTFVGVISIDLSQYSKGLYLLKISYGENIILKKVVVE